MKALSETDHRIVTNALALYIETFQDSPNIEERGLTLRAQWLKDCLREGLVSLMASGER